MTLELLAAANAFIALAFVVIASLILVGLIRDRSLGTNPLGIATFLVFSSCALGHAVHAEHYLLDGPQYVTSSDSWHLLVVDSLTAAAAAGYLAQRRRFGLVIRGNHPMLDYHRRLQIAQALRDIGQDIAAQTDFDRLLRRVVLHARDLLNADYAAIVTSDASGKQNRQVIGTRTDGWDDQAWSQAVFLSVIDRPGDRDPAQRFVVIDDLQTVLPADKRDFMVHGVEGACSVLSVPICPGSKVSGALMVAYRTPRQLSQDEVSSAAALASQAAFAIEKARLIDSLRQADRMKDEFLAAAAHELRTPVTAIKGWADVLLGDKGGRADGQKALETIRRQAERMTRLSEDLLAVMRFQPGLPHLDQEPLDLSALVLESVDSARRIEHRREFDVVTAGSLPVRADRRMIAETLDRLIENAVRYSPAGLSIKIETRSASGEGVVSITDQGIGIPPERQPHVFEPFYEPVPPGARGYVGTVSLGLHLSKQIVEAHGGRIWFTSAQGEGSTFSFSLPLA